MKPIHILVTMNETYALPFQVMVTSLVQNNPGQRFELWLLHSSISQARLEKLRIFCHLLGTALHDIAVEEERLRSAPVLRYYPQEMYYRLLAAQLLPRHLERILYLDPDILVINPLRPLWETDLQGCLFAAASHTGKTDFSNDINRLRLNVEHDYYNTGVLLMDLAQARQTVHPEDMFQFVQERGQSLILPDQDVFNSLYGDRVLPLDDALWNYDARKYSSYLLRSGGEYTWPWVLEHTAILHFCGSNKPWKPNCRLQLALLYRHYMQIQARVLSGAALLSPVEPAPAP